MKRSKLREQTIVRPSKRKDSMLPVEECTYRLEVVTKYLNAGVSIVKIDILRSLLEKKTGY